MAKDLSDNVRDALQQVVSEAVKNIGDAKDKTNSLSGARGLAVGAGLASLAPIAKKGFDAVRSNGGPSLPSIPTPKPGKAASKVGGKAASKLGDKVGGKLKEGVSEKVDEAGGAAGLAKQAAGGILPGGGGNDSGKDGMEGVGKGRRMPVQQSVDVAVPVETAYNQWTQFEDWPQFMHRVTRVTQEEDDSVSFATKIWGKTKEFVAEIETQRPDERIKWSVKEGITHTGVVTFHELAPRLTRIELNVDVDPGSLIEKAARGMRAIKRAMRADLHRFKAFIEMQELETGAWRGVIEDGEVVEEHDESYDEERDYSDVDDLSGGSEDEEDEEDEEQEDEEEDSRQGRSRQRAKGQTQRSARGGSSQRRSKSSSGSSKASNSGSSKASNSGSSKASGSSRSSGRSRTQSRSRSSSNGSSAKSSGGSKRSKSSGSSSSRSRSGGNSTRKSSSRS